MTSRATPSTSGSRTEDLPDPDNRVSVDRDGKITLSYTPNNQVPKQKLYDKLKSMLGHLGMDPDHLIPRNAYLKNEIPDRGRGSSGRNLPIRHGSEELGSRRQLQSA